MTRTMWFWSLWLLGTLAMIFVWLFGHVPAASTVILGISNGLALCSLGFGLFVGRGIWKVPEGCAAHGSTQAGLKLIYVVAGLQCLTTAFWMVDVIAYELRGG